MSWQNALLASSICRLGCFFLGVIWLLLHPCILVASPEWCDVEFHRSTRKNHSVFLCFQSLPLVDVTGVGFCSGLRAYMQMCECKCLTDDVGSTPESSPPSQPVGWDLGLLKPEVSYVVLGTAGCVSCPIFCCHLVGCRHPAKPLTYLLARCRHLGCGDFSHMALVFIWWNWLLCLTASPGMGPKLFRCFDQISVSCPVLFPALLPPLCNKDCPLLLVWLDLQLWQTSACISHCRELVQLVLALLADVNVHDSANPSNYQVSSQLP